MLTNEKILITGPASQVGLPIARELVKQNEVYGLARFSNPADQAQLEALGVKCIAADLAEDSFETLPEDFTYVLNLAVVKSESNFDYDLAANAEGTGRLMSHCRRAKAWLQCSSGGVYQPAGHQPLKESDPLGDSHRMILPTYSISKIAAETMVRFGAREWGVPAIIARLSVPYGDNGGWPAMHLEWMLAGQPIVVHSDAPSVYNPLHEDDYIAHVPRLLRAATVPATVVNWGGSDEVSVEEWCEYIAQLTGLQAQFAQTDMMLPSLPLDLTRMHRILGRTKVDWKDGIRRMIRARQPELPLKEL
jgi:nucleoside-diphosphate-sugar epimerase